MEECNENRKRARDESGDDSPRSGLTRVDSSESEANSSEWKRIRSQSSDSSGSTRAVADSSESTPDSPGASQIRGDLLDILDEADAAAERDQAIQGLDSVIKSFEEEIFVPAPGHVEPVSGESQLELGYLLEASDDELGIPPPASAEGGSEMRRIQASDFVPSPPHAAGFGGMLGFDDEMNGYDSFDFGFGFGGASENMFVNNNQSTGEYVALGGLFEHSEPAADASEFLWRPESLPAV